MLENTISLTREIFKLTSLHQRKYKQTKNFNNLSDQNNVYLSESAFGNFIPRQFLGQKRFTLEPFGPKEQPFKRLNGQPLEIHSYPEKGWHDQIVDKEIFLNILDGDEKDSWDYFKAAVPDVRILAGERFGKFGRKLQHQMWISLNAHIHQNDKKTKLKKDKNTQSKIWKKAST